MATCRYLNVYCYNAKANPTMNQVFYNAPDLSELHRPRFRQARPPDIIGTSQAVARPTIFAASGRGGAGFDRVVDEKRPHLMYTIF